MDLNHRLIEAVRQCPLLYQNNASLADRKCGWEEIAQQMKMHEAILKTRWHFLREHYKRTVLSGNQFQSHQFPYRKEMEFLLPYMRKSSQEETQNEKMLSLNIIKPEFVITEQDLENDDSGGEEYVFLEVETLGPEYEINNEIMQQRNESDIRKELEGEHEEQRQQDEENEIEEIDVEAHVNKDVSEIYKQHDDGKQDDLKPNMHEIQQATCNKNGIKEEETVRTQIQEASEEKIEAKVEVREGDSSSDHIGADNLSYGNNANADERCEDAIFGELVSAMLRKMPTEKKRAVKRDIMNLLLT